jgi:hypothetical protein
VPTVTCPGCGRAIALALHELQMPIECARCDVRFVPTTGEVLSAPDERVGSAEPAVPGRRWRRRKKRAVALRVAEECLEITSAVDRLLSTASLAAGAAAAVLICVPCLWSLAVPVAACGLVLGVVAAVSAAGRGRGVGLALASCALCLVVGVADVAFTVWSYAQAAKAIDRLNKDLDEAHP